MKTTVWVGFLLCGCHAFNLSAKSMATGSGKPIIKTSVSKLSDRFCERELIRPSLVLSSTASSPPEEGGQLDSEALVKYGAAWGVQVSLFYGLFLLMDYVVASAGVDVPFWANFAFFYGMSIRSRVLNPLSNKRPDPRTFEVDGKEEARNLPTWTPPGFIFPTMWGLIIGPIRAVSATMVYETTHSYAVPAILALAAHLSIGDIWNTINNVEQRYGAAVAGVGCVWLSKAFTAYQFAQVSPMAGQLMALTLIWLTVASALVTRIWQLNPDSETGETEPLYPVVGKASTEFAWFTQTEN